MTHSNQDCLPLLHVSPSSTSKSSPNLRRHFSEAAIDLVKLFENHKDENKEKEEEEEEEEEQEEEQVNDSIDLSAFSVKDAIKFSDELKKIMESLRYRKDLPPKSVINGLLDVLEIWINDHGINAINKLNQEIDKYQELELRYSKEKDILNQTIDCIEI